MHRVPSRLRSRVVVCRREGVPGVLYMLGTNRNDPKSRHDIVDLMQATKPNMTFVDTDAWRMDAIHSYAQKIDPNVWYEYSVEFQRMKFDWHHALISHITMLALTDLHSIGKLAFDLFVLQGQPIMPGADLNVAYLEACKLARESRKRTLAWLAGVNRNNLCPS